MKGGNVVVDVDVDVEVGADDGDGDCSDGVAEDEDRWLVVDSGGEVEEGSVEL